MSLLGTNNVIVDTPVQRATQQPGPYATKGLSDKESAEACLATARELEGSGFDQEAIVAYERALGFAPKQTGLAFPLARLYAKIGNKDRAIQYFRASLTERPNDPQILGDYGYFLFEQRDFAGAEQQLREALKVQPDNKRNQTNLAMVLYANSRIGDSLKAFEAAAGQAAARFNLAVLLAKDGRPNESRQFIREALLIDPQMPEALAFEAWLNGDKAQSPALGQSSPGSASAGSASVSLSP
jgi:Flp pilus assembly protein TadD